MEKTGFFNQFGLGYQVDIAKTLITQLPSSRTAAPDALFAISPKIVFIADYWSEQSMVLGD